MYGCSGGSAQTVGCGFGLLQSIGVDIRHSGRAFPEGRMIGLSCGETRHNTRKGTHARTHTRRYKHTLFEYTFWSTRKKN